MFHADTQAEGQTDRQTDRHEANRLFQNTNLVHNSFNLQQYICYTTLLNMFRAARCSSSGGPIVSPQSLVSSPWKFGERSYINKMRSAVLLKQYWDKTIVK